MSDDTRRRRRAEKSAEERPQLMEGTVEYDLAQMVQIIDEVCAKVYAEPQRERLRQLTENIMSR
jgi:hypothetical protein